MDDDNINNNTLTEADTPMTKTNVEKNDNWTCEVLAHDLAGLQSVRTNVTINILNAPTNITTINEYPLTNITTDTSIFKVNMYN